MEASIRLIAVGMPTEIRHNGKTKMTGIFKTPVDGRVSVSLLGITGDGQADLTVHGGRNKAVYVYPECHYKPWAEELGLSELEPSQFGENLTVRGLSEQTVAIGDSYQIGSVTVIVTQPRLPCFKLGIRMKDDSFPQRFLQSGRLGFYLGVEQEGEFGRGERFELIDRPGHGITVHDLWHTVFGLEADKEKAERCLELLPHLDAGWKRRLRKIVGS